MTQTAVRSIREEANALPRAATVYGIRELARRAEVPGDLLRSWRFEFDDDGYANVFLSAGSTGRLRFPLLDRKVWKEIQSGTIRTSIADWRNPSANRPLPSADLRVPFSSSDVRNVGPLFRRTASDVVACPIDLAAATVLTLSRFE